MTGVAHTLAFSHERVTCPRYPYQQLRGNPALKGYFDPLLLGSVAGSEPGWRDASTTAVRSHLVVVPEEKVNLAPLAALSGAILSAFRWSENHPAGHRGHILNCTPETGSVKKRFKSAMLLQCRVTETANRHVTSLSKLDYRPTLLISEVVQLEDDSKGQSSLFR